MFLSLPAGGLFKKNKKVSNKTFFPFRPLAPTLALEIRSGFHRDARREGFVDVDGRTNTSVHS